MITAKNYAAQAIKGLQDFYKRAGKGLTEKEDILIQSFINHIEKSVKFVIPDDGLIFNDNFKGLNNSKINLPFENISIEYWDSVENLKVVVFASKDSGTDSIWVAATFNHKTINNTWFPELHVAYLDSNSIIEGGGYKYNLGFPSLLPIMKSRTVGGYQPRIHNFIRSIPELIEALSCKNITTANHQAASPVNEKRIKAGKLPFYETKILMIDTRSSSGKSAISGGSHASPRQHLRRGHIRRLESGNIWVNSCVVGDSYKGSISKQYAVM